MRGRPVGKGVDWSLLDVCVNRADVGGVRRREKEREGEREGESETEMEWESREWEGVWINRDGQREVPRKSLLLRPLARITAPPVVRVHRKRSDNPFMCSLRIESSEQW